ncbi:TetR/AcrR family transcriptional regulator [Nocardia sp. NPDC004123]
MSTDVRRRILDVTLDLIGEHGIGGLSNRAIARTAGVSLGTLTYHFASQDDLLGQALELFVNDEIERLTALTSRLDSTSETEVDEVLRRTRAAIEASTTRAAQVAQLELYLHATRSPELRAVASRCYQAYDELAAAVLRTLGIAEPERFAPLLGALIDGFGLRRLAVGEPRVNLVEGLAALTAGLTLNPGAGPGRNLSDHADRTARMSADN